MRDHGKKIKCQGMVYINMQMEPYIKVNGRIINIMARVNTNFLTEHYMKVNGKIIWCMELGFILTLKEENGMDNLEKENFNRNCKNS